MEHAFAKMELLMHQSQGQNNKAELWESLKGQVVKMLDKTFASRRKDEKLYIL
jgi:hypothetical protein